MRCWARRSSRASCAATAPTVHAGVARRAGARPDLWSAPHRAAHARAGAACPAPTTWAAQGPRRAQRVGRQRAGPPVLCRGPEPKMGGRLHLNQDGRGLAVRGGGAGPVLAAHRGLVDAGEHDLAARGGRTHDGCVAEGQTCSTAAPLGPGKPSTPASTSRSCWMNRASHAA